jgi:hypothetical protein
MAEILSLATLTTERKIIIALEGGLAADGAFGL